jgi:hypothetical protein
MRQVFFKTVSALQAAAGTAGDARFNDLSSGELGFWTLDAATGGDWFATDLFTATVDTVAVAKAIPFYKNFQVVQGFPSNNPIASPIISNQNLVKVTADPYAASVRHKVRISPQAADNTDQLNIKVIMRNTPTDYLSYVNNESTISDLSGGGYDFPLGNYNTTNHKAINLAITGGANEAGTVDNIVTAITNNNTWNALFTTTDNGNTVDLEARHIGVVFDIIFENLSATPTTTQGALQAAWSAGSGNPVTTGRLVLMSSRLESTLVTSTGCTSRRATQISLLMLLLGSVTKSRTAPTVTEMSSRVRSSVLASSTKLMLTML